ncbi:MAG: hypothetical protein ABR992_17755 [Solirubrobacteraceae bacterium]|jgi:hypothetical protein
MNQGRRLQLSRTRVASSLFGAAAVMLGLALLTAAALGESGHADVHARTAHAKSRVCRVPRLTGLVVSVARERAAKAGCGVRLVGTRVTDPHTQTIRRQAPSDGRHGRVVSVWVNPVCYGDGAAGPGINEPLVTSGPTELISGLYIVGGPLATWSEPQCKPRHGESASGTITVREATTGSVVTTQSVVRGQLATIPLPPGSYTIQGTFGNATINEHPGESPPQTVEIEADKTVRQDVFLSVP